MKLSVFFSILLLSCALKGQTTASIDDTVAALQHQKLILDRSEKIAGSAQVVKYSRGTDLRIVELNTKENDLFKQVIWYFSKGQLIYTSTLWQQDHVAPAAFTEYLYFHEGTLLSWTNSKNSAAAPGSKEFMQTGEEVLKYAKTLQSK